MKQSQQQPNSILNEVGDLGLGLYPINEQDQDKIKSTKNKENKEGK